MRVGILTGGGDCPGLNAVIRATAKALHREGCEAVGILDGFLGLIQGRTVLLNDLRVSGILQRGGTILGSSNRDNPFDFVGEIDGETFDGVDVTDRVFEHVREAKLDAVVVVGGDGTQAMAHRFQGMGLDVVGVPKTIDNDLLATDVTFGFDSARQVVSESIDRLHTTADSHGRIMFLETMGRDSGFIALHGGIAGGGDVILIPEIPFTIDGVVAALQDREERGKRASIVVVAEGAIPSGGEKVFQVEGTKRLGGIAHKVADAVQRRVDHQVRVTVLGYLQRGGSPTAFDRVLGTRFGYAAASLAKRGEFGRMVVLKGSSIESVPLEEVAGAVRTVDPEGEMVAAARAVGTRFGDVSDP